MAGYRIVPGENTHAESLGMRTAGAIEVACTLSDHVALRRVIDCIQHEGGHAVALAQAEVLDATAGRKVSALVYDMEPEDAPPPAFLRRVHAARPDWPIWLYHRRCVPVMEWVAEVGSLRSVWATAQLPGPEHETEIRVHVRRLLTSVPRVRLLHLLDSVLRPLPTEGRGFLEMGLERLDQGQAKRFRIRNGTAGNRGELRHLERVCLTATGLGPKRLFDRLLLVFLTFKTLAFDLPLDRAAEQVGLSSKDLDRLRCRVLGADADSAALEPRAQFEYALIALTRACKVPEQAARRIVQQVVRERLA